MKLPRRIAKLIEERLGRTFESLKDRLLVISGYSKFNLPGVYMEAVKESGGSPDLETLQSMVDTTKNYLDSVKLQAVNVATKEVEAHMQANSKPKPEEVEKILRQTWGNVTSKVEQIVNSETTAFRNVGLLEGVIRVAAVKGIADPNVAFITSKDSAVCDECIRLHMDGGNPRVFKLSEVSHGYVKKGTAVPSIYGLHPNCRCSMILVLPNFGFENGKLSYISSGFNAYENQ
jgi:hypothetical protein